MVDIWFEVRQKFGKIMLIWVDKHISEIYKLFKLGQEDQLKLGIYIE